jgi:hypothetical protein
MLLLSLRRVRQPRIKVMIQETGCTGNWGPVIDQFPKNHKKILSEHFNAEVGRQNNFKPTFGNERLHEISNDCAFTIIKLVSLINEVLNSAISSRRANYKQVFLK